MSYLTGTSVIGQAEQDFAIYDSNAATGKSDLGKEDFLTLLVAQLTNQDPLDPMEDKEFTSQMAEFSSLEQLTNISDGIDQMSQGDARQEMLSAVSFIGKNIRAGGDSLSKLNGAVSALYFEVDEAIAGGFINIYDAAGGLVRTVQLGARQAGSYEFNWDGKDYKGANLPDGVYTIGMAAEGAEGQTVLVKTEVSGVVAGVQSDSGVNYMRLTDGRIVNFMNIKEVVNPESQTQDQE